MTKWLTTGQMIDRLKVGVIAETEEQKSNSFISGKFTNHATVRDDGLISFCSKDGNCMGYGLFSLTEQHRNLMWRILPKYVTFEEAMKALKEGKVITWQKWNDENQELSFSRENFFDMFIDNDVSIDEFCSGKFIIEE
ncbi:hypothetical protein [Metabacillus sp. Hm71]|uniref:hypothetical protein n=1 Tax=Metabacillus sp. Hm71 TaxID=3450743 RepID=UPI003F43726C